MEVNDKEADSFEIQLLFPILKVLPAPQISSIANRTQLHYDQADNLALHLETTQSHLDKIAEDRTSLHQLMQARTRTNEDEFEQLLEARSQMQNHDPATSQRSPTVLHRSPLERYKGVRMPLILVVDDDIFNVNAITHIIEGMDLKLPIDKAFSNQEAMKKINKRNSLIHD